MGQAGCQAGSVPRPPSLGLPGFLSGPLWGKGIKRVGLLFLSLVINLLSVCPDYSDAREGIQRLTGHGAEDSRADQFANEWGRSGKDPNHFRPAGLPSKY